MDLNFLPDIGRMIANLPSAATIFSRERTLAENVPQRFTVSLKLNGIDPETYLDTVLARIASHPINRVGELLPWRVAGAVNQGRSSGSSLKCVSA